MARKVLGNGHEFVALGQDQRRLRFRWGEVNGPEAVEGSAENARLRGFIYDLCRKIVQDYAVVVPCELSLQLMEGESHEQNGGQVFEPHWEINLASPRCHELRGTEALDCLRIVIKSTSKLRYFAQLSRNPEEDYHGVFQAELELFIQPQTDADGIKIDIRDVADRMLRLVHGAYQQEIYLHYPEWRTNYQPIPILCDTYDGDVI